MTRAFGLLALCAATLPPPRSQGADLLADGRKPT
jgi:hypothetical protein